MKREEIIKEVESYRKSKKVSNTIYDMLNVVHPEINIDEFLADFLIQQIGKEKPTPLTDAYNKMTNEVPGNTKRTFKPQQPDTGVEAQTWLKESGYDENTARFRTELNYKEVAYLMGQFLKSQKQQWERERGELKSMYQECLEKFLPIEKWDEATRFLSEYGTEGKIGAHFINKNQ